MKALITPISFLLCGWLFPQHIDSISLKTDPQPSSLIAHTFQDVGGLVAYYFWEEDEKKNIFSTQMERPFLKNDLISIHQRNNKEITTSDLTTTISTFTKKCIKNRVAFHLSRQPATNLKSVIYIKKNNKWESEEALPVLYFTVSNNKWNYSHSSDSILLKKDRYASKSNGHFFIVTYLKDSSTVEKEEIYTYSGENITNSILANQQMIPQRILIFSNGYRGPKKDRDVTDDLATRKDRYHYWFSIDDQFIKRFQPATTYYIDGNMRVNTTNHKTAFRFLVSYLRVSAILNKKRAKSKYTFLNTTPNIEGFQQRKEKGRIAGKAFMTARCNSPACQNTKDTLDIVCYSMGYAYALGFIEEIKEKVVFGKMYILAPENASTDAVDWSLFQEVWQYGSNLGAENPDPVWEQDGIAPQCQVKGLETIPPGKGGRVFIPVDWPKKNFIDSHQPYNFDWIFERIKPGEAGYIYK